MNRLKEIIKAKKARLKLAKKALSLSVLKKKRPSFEIRDFKSALKKSDISLIAEMKKASPSAGILRGNFDPIEIAKTYQAAGASVLSILTEEDYFQGRLDYINIVKRNTSLPILRKDFIFDEYQIFESYAAGADAILLLVSVLSFKKLKQLYNLAKNLGLASLVEVCSKPELKKALAIGAEIIGINNRNLKNFKVDLENTDKLVKHIPQGKIIVSESGIKTRQDILHLKELGVNAVLIGEVFMREANIEAKVRELFG